MSVPTPVFWPGEFHGLYSSWVINSLAQLNDFHFTSRVESRLLKVKSLTAKKQANFQILKQHLKILTAFRGQRKDDISD